MPNQRRVGIRENNAPGVVVDGGDGPVDLISPVGINVNGVPLSGAYVATGRSYVPADLIGWTFDPALALTGGAGQSATNMFLFRIPITGPITLTNTLIYLATLGDTLTNAYSVAYKSDGTKIGQSADQSTAWGTAGATGVKTIPLAGGPFTVTPVDSNDFIWTGFYVGAATTTPAFQRVTGAPAGMFNAGTVAARTRAGYVGVANTATLPTITPSGLTPWASIGWMAIS